MQAILERQTYLNYYVTETIGKNCAFKLLYWGGLSAHHDHPIHRHSYFEVCYVMKGNGIYEENGNEYPLAEHTLFLSRPGLWHKISSNQGIGLIWTAFELIENESSQVMLSKLMKSKTIYLPDATENASVLLWNNLLSLVEPEKSNLEEQLSCMSHALLLSFFQQFTDPNESELNEPHQPFVERIHSQLLYRVKRFIRDNLSQTIRLKELADYFNVSERQLIRLFHQEETNLSFSEYMQKERIKQAKSLIQTTILSVKEIADTTGFSSVHHFTRVFKKETGETPARYRKMIGI